jgi:hypothetical protein
MLNILFPSIVLDRNSILSGAFPSLPKLKNMINSYKSELPSEGRVVIISDDSEVFVSHIPRLDLVPVELNEDKNVSDRQNEPVAGQNPIERIRDWCVLCFEAYNQYPNREQIKQAWLELTGNDLSDIALDLLIEKLGIG